MKTIIPLTEQEVFEALAKVNKPLQVGEIAKLLFISSATYEYGKLKTLLEKMERQGLLEIEAYKSSPCQRCIGRKTYRIKKA